MKRAISLLACGALLSGLLMGCGPSGAPASTGESDDQEAKTTVYISIAASLVSSFEEIIPLYNETHPNVTISVNSGSSGKLMQEIQEADGHGIDIFFSAGKSQVTTLEEDGLVVEGTTQDLLQNQLCCPDLPLLPHALRRLKRCGIF